MRLTKAHIKNFRAISDLEFDVGQHTVFVGANGVGKSCALKGIDKFFSKSANVGIEDFHERNTDDPIEITLTFAELTANETEVFASRIHSGEMVVSRVFRVGTASRENGKYYGLSLRRPEFQEIRAIEGAIPRRTAFNALAGSAGFEDLPQAANAGQIIEHMDTWEAGHPAQCQLLRDDGQFFGFSNVARGALAKYISFVFIPAVRDASADSLNSKGSVISQLIDLLVKSVVQKREDIRKWQKEASEKYQELVSPESLGELGELAGSLSETLKIFYDDTGVDLAWRPPEELQVSLPLADVSLIEQGYQGPVENKGHGLQRAFIFTLLQHLAKALSRSSEDKGDGEGDEQGQQQGQRNDDVGVDQEGTQEDPVSHSVILAIEEPELYQHPVKQRHVSKVLEQISGGHIPGVMSQTQTLLCSHSPHFISTKRFDDIRLARRESLAEGEPAQCVVHRVSYEKVVEALDTAYQTPPGGHDVEGLKARLHTLDEAVNEGFFCNVAVLVEGVSDRAALLAVAKAQGVDLESKGIAILEVGGKGNLDRPLTIFQLLNIPTYVVYDSDGDKSEGDQKPQQNLAIQRLCGETSPIAVRLHIGDRFASFESNLNDVLKNDLGEHYQDQVELAGIKFGMKAKDVLKNPVACSEVITACMDLGGSCHTIAQIIQKIEAVSELPWV